MKQMNQLIAIWVQSPDLELDPRGPNWCNSESSIGVQVGQLLGLESRPNWAHIEINWFQLKPIETNEPIKVISISLKNPTIFSIAGVVITASPSHVGSSIKTFITLS